MIKLDEQIANLNKLVEIAEELLRDYEEVIPRVVYSGNGLDDWTIKIDIGFSLDEKRTVSWNERGQRRLSYISGMIQNRLKPDEQQAISHMIIDAHSKGEYIPIKDFVALLQTFVQARATALETDVLSTLKDSIRLSLNIPIKEN